MTQQHDLARIQLPREGPARPMLDDPVRFSRKVRRRLAQPRTDPLTFVQDGHRLAEYACHRCTPTSPYNVWELGVRLLQLVVAIDTIECKGCQAGMPCPTAMDTLRDRLDGITKAFIRRGKLKKKRKSVEP